jgi:hypothetical protein
MDGKRADMVGREMECGNKDERLNKIKNKKGELLELATVY